MSLQLTPTLLADCCLDVEWLNEDTFASAGADMKIFLMRVDENDAIKVFKLALGLSDCIDLFLIIFLVDTRMKSIKFE